MKEGFERYNKNNNIVKKDLSEKEKEYWAKFQPTEKTGSEDSLQDVHDQLQAEKNEKHKDLTGIPIDYKTINQESKEFLENYKEDLDNRVDTLYNLADELKGVEILALDESYPTMTKTTSVRTLETVNAFIPLIVGYGKSEKLKEEELVALGVTTNQQRLKQIIDKVSNNEDLHVEDINFLSDIEREIIAFAKNLEETTYTKPQEN
jgi:hypothetical protein